MFLICCMSWCQTIQQHHWAVMSKIHPPPDVCCGLNQLHLTSSFFCTPIPIYASDSFILKPLALSFCKGGSSSHWLEFTFNKTDPVRCSHICIFEFVQVLIFIGYFKNNSRTDSCYRYTLHTLSSLISQHNYSTANRELLVVVQLLIVKWK